MSGAPPAVVAPAQSAKAAAAAAKDSDDEEEVEQLQYKVRTNRRRGWQEKRAHNMAWLQ